MPRVTGDTVTGPGAGSTSFGEVARYSYADSAIRGYATFGGASAYIWTME